MWCSLRERVHKFIYQGDCVSLCFTVCHPVCICRYDEKALVYINQLLTRLRYKNIGHALEKLSGGYKCTSVTSAEASFMKRYTTCKSKMAHNLPIITVATTVFFLLTFTFGLKLFSRNLHMVSIIISEALGSLKCYQKEM